MERTILLIGIILIILFCIHKIIQLVILDKILKEKQEEFDKILISTIEEAKKEIETRKEKKEENKIVKKATTKRIKKSERKEEK